MKQYQYLHAVQHLATQLSADLKNEKQELLKLHAIIRQLEDELTQLRRQANEPSSSSPPVPSEVDPSYSATLQSKCALEHVQILKPIRTITILGASSSLELRINNWQKKSSRKGFVVKQLCLSSDPNLLFYKTIVQRWNLGTQTLSCGS